MSRDPSTPLAEEQVIEILVRLLKIQNGNPESDSQSKLAADYRVEKKTISRIKTGATWAHLHRRFFSQVAPAVAVLQKFDSLQEAPEDVHRLVGFLAEAKALYGLSHDLPLHYGRYDWIDGVHVVATDGLITWEQANLFEIAIKAQTSGVIGHPIFCDKAEELPTFALAEMMTKPVGDKFVQPEDLGNGVWRLTGEEGRAIFLQERYMRLVRKLSLDVCQAGAQYEFVYLTKLERGDTPTVFAALATLEIP